MRIERESLVGSPRSGSDCVTGGRVRPIIRMPDPLLRRSARPCAPGDPGVAEVVADLTRTMTRHPGCRGLSAPQIGQLLRIVAVDVAGPTHDGARAGPLVLVDPQLVSATGAWTGSETCLSIPGVVADVQRADHLLVVAFSGEGETTTLELMGSDAALLQHELDHLDGLLTLDRLQSLSDLSPLPAGPPTLPVDASSRLPSGDPARPPSP
jgi:peptide deformylase